MARERREPSRQCLRGLDGGRPCLPDRVGVFAGIYNVEFARVERKNIIKDPELVSERHRHSRKEFELGRVISGQKVERVEQQRGLNTGELTSGKGRSPIRYRETARKRREIDQVADVYRCLYERKRRDWD